jgi:hypothetical protein
MIIIGSAILFIFGVLLLLIQAARIAVGLAMICYYLIKIAVCLTVAALAGLRLVGQLCVNRYGSRGIPMQEPEPGITINIFTDDHPADEGPIIELPRGSFRRVRG